MNATLNVFWRKTPVHIQIDGHRSRCGRCSELKSPGKIKAECKQFGTITRPRPNMGQYRRHQKCLECEVKP